MDFICLAKLGESRALLGVAIASFAAMAVGMIWYSPVLFVKPWMKLTGINSDFLEKEKSKGMAPLYLAAFLNNVVLCTIFYYLVRLTRAATFPAMAVLAMVCWLGFIGTTQFSSVIWEKKPFGLYLINAGHYLAVLLTAAGVYTLLGLGI